MQECECGSKSTGQQRECGPAGLLNERSGRGTIGRWCSWSDSKLASQVRRWCGLQSRERFIMSGPVSNVLQLAQIGTHVRPSPGRKNIVPLGEHHSYQFLNVG